MTTKPQNAAYWKRRALKAELEVETYKQFRQVDYSMEGRMIRENAVLRQVFQEIREAVETAAQCRGGEV